VGDGLRERGSRMGFKLGEADLGSTWRLQASCRGGEHGRKEGDK
jgi:hypothetical protein